MTKNKLLIIAVIFLINSCGYNPIYQNNNNQQNLNIELIELIGDQELNQYIKINLRQYINSNSQNKFLIIIKSKYIKDTLAKDLTGNTTENKLTADVNFTITKNDIESNFSISESLIMSGISNVVDERNYEKSLKENLISNISEKFINHLLTKE